MIPTILTETRLTTEGAADILFTTARTVVRWMTDGRPVPGSSPVVLEAEQVGRRWVTSREAVGRFVAAVKAAKSPPPVASPAAVNRESARAKKLLAKFGVGTGGTN